MSQKISGRNFSVNLGDKRIHIQTATLEITDNTAVDKTAGVPNGYTDGDVEASGEIVVDARSLALIMDAAKTAGSFRELPLFDMLFYAKTTGAEKKVKAHDCKLMLASVLDIDTNSSDKETTSIPYIVTGPDFVWINGIPYLSKADIEGLK